MKKQSKLGIADIDRQLTVQLFESEIYWAAHACQTASEYLGSRSDAAETLRHVVKKLCIAAYGPKGPARFKTIRKAERRKVV